jgi:hypothetical protein
MLFSDTLLARALICLLHVFFSSEDDDLSYYLSEIDEGLLDGYVGIIQGLKSAEKVVPGALDAFLNPSALDQGCLQLLMGLAEYEDKPDAVLKSAVGLIGNFMSFTPMLLPFSNPPILQATCSKILAERSKAPI